MRQPPLGGLVASPGLHCISDHRLPMRRAATLMWAHGSLLQGLSTCLSAGVGATLCCVVVLQGFSIWHGAVAVCVSGYMHQLRVHNRGAVACLWRLMASREQYMGAG